MYITTQFELAQCFDTVTFFTCTLSLLGHVFFSRIVHPCHIVPICPLLQIPSTHLWATHGNVRLLAEAAKTKCDRKVNYSTN